MANVKQLAEDGYKLKQQIGELSIKLDEINGLLAKQTEFKDGVKTGYLQAGDIKVKVVLRENVKWDQEKLTTVQSYFPADFANVFKAEYKPASKKSLDLTMAKNPEFEKAVIWSRTVTNGKPGVSYELVEEAPF